LLTRFFTLIIVIKDPDSKDLARCLSSILEQDYDDYEVIIIDGSSNPLSIRLCKDKIRYFHSNTEYNGIYKSWNAGIKKSLGDWILFVGHDDFLLNNNVLSRLNEMMNGLSLTVDFISTSVIKGDPNAYLSGDIKDTFEKSYKYGVRELPPYPGLLHSRKIFNKFGLFDEELRFSSDLKFFFQARSNSSTLLSIPIKTIFFSVGGITNRCGNRVARFFEERKIDRDLGWTRTRSFIIKQFLRAVLKDSLCFWLSR